MSAFARAEPAEKHIRDAPVTGPSLGANALAPPLEPTAGDAHWGRLGIITHRSQGKLDQLWCADADACLRDTLFWSRWLPLFHGLAPRRIISQGSFSAQPPKLGLYESGRCLFSSWRVR